jgi:hypothetical protein
MIDPPFLQTVEFLQPLGVNEGLNFLLTGQSSLLGTKFTPGGKLKLLKLSSSSFEEVAD